jgi:hypothetical protein
MPALRLRVGMAFPPVAGRSSREFSLRAATGPFVMCRIVARQSRIDLLPTVNRRVQSAAGWRGVFHRRDERLASSGGNAT